jgi:hypothetical protein
MSSITCSQCGLVNFISAEHCKRCKATLSAPPASKPLPAFSNGATQDARIRPADKPRPTLSKGLTQYAGNSEKELLINEPAFVTEPARRMRLSPLRILLVILLVLGGCWYQMQKWDAERAATLKADKEVDDNLREIDQRTQPPRR